MAPSHFCTSAIILRTYDYSEADRILVLFTEHEGKVRALAKGVRKTRSRMAGSLGLLSRTEVQLHGKSHRDLFLVTQAQLVTAFPRIKSDLSALGQAARCGELVDRLTPDRHPQSEVFHLFDQALGLLDEGQSPALVGAWFEIRLLETSGYGPRLTTCSTCGREQGTMAYAPERGGLVCSHCRPGGQPAISMGGRRLLEKLRILDARRLGQLRLSAGMEGELTALLDSALTYQTGRRLNTDKFRAAVARLEKLAPVGNTRSCLPSKP